MENMQPSECKTSELEVMKKKEDEHCRLQRQVRMIQADRTNRIMGVHPQFRKQDHLLRTLKKEYLNLIKDLKIAKSGAHKKNDKKTRTQLKKQILLMTQTQFACVEGMTMMEQLDELLQRMNREILLLRKKTKATQGRLNQRRYQSEQRLVSTENKLATAKLRFNTVQFENKLIREEIEHMLIDRASFNQTWNKLMSALGKGKKFLMDLFESSTLAYDQRDEWVNKLKSIQEKGKMEQMVQVQEMRELQQAFDHEMKIYNFLAKKGVKRINQKQEQREEEQKRQAEEDNKREYYKHCQILDEIYEYSKDDNINNITDSFERLENENFSKYKLLTEYCAENEVLTRDLKRIRIEMMDREDWNEMMEAKRQEKLYGLRKELEEAQKRTAALSANFQEQSQRLDDYMTNICDIFNILECSLAPFENLLGDEGPSVHRLQLTLQLISEKINEYVQTVYYYEHVVQKRSDKIYTSRLKKYTVHCEPPECLESVPIDLLVPAAPCPACIEARWLSRVSEGPEKPFNKDMVLAAIRELSSDPAYVRSDRIHQLTECRVPSSRAILAKRYMNN